MVENISVILSKVYTPPDESVLKENTQTSPLLLLRVDKVVSHNLLTSQLSDQILVKLLEVPVCYSTSFTYHLDPDIYGICNTDEQCGSSVSAQRGTASN